MVEYYLFEYMGIVRVIVQDKKMENGSREWGERREAWR